MKYIYRFSLLLCIFLLLTACQHKPAPTTPQPQSTQQTDETTTVDIPEDTTVLVPSYENLYSAALPITTETGYDDNGNAIFHYDYQTIHLIIPDIDVADKIIIDFLSRVEQTRANAEQLQAYAENEANVSSLTEPYTYQIHYNTTRIDQGVLSLFGQSIQSGDAMHSSRQCLSANYDLVTGDVLTLGSILYRAESKDALANLVIENLKQQDHINLYDEYEETVLQRFSKDESTDEAFYFTPYGLCFYFSPYEIAPYSVGVVTAQIPYQDLTGIIGDAYFPAEKTYANGIVSISDFAEADLDHYEQFSEIILDSTAPMHLISVQGGVQDVQICLIDNSGYRKTVYASNVLSESTAILLQANLTDETSQLMLSYFSGGETYEFPITQPMPTLTFPN